MSGKSVSIKNKTTNEWEIVAGSDASQISTSNPDVLVSGEVNISVDQALSRTNKKIETLQRNVSWLAEHGGGGGGGGGDFTSSIKLTNGGITTSEGVNILYSTTKEVKLDYLITALKNNQKFTITVSLDGNSVISGQEGWSGTPGSLIIKNISQYSSSNSHSVVVTATDAEGINATPYMLTVIESSINLSSSVSSVTATIGLAYKITYTVTNKVLAADTSLIVNNVTNGVSKTFELGKFTSTEPLLYDVDFFSLFTGTPTAGSSYTIEAFAQTSIDGKTITSDKVTNKVVVEDGTSLVVLVDGITTKEEVTAGTPATEFPQGGNISFSFTPYLSGISIIYYAVRMKRGNIVRDIGTFEPDAENPFNENQYVQRGKQQIFSWAVAQNDDYLGDWDITLRCWSEKGSPMTDTQLACVVVKSAQSLIADQNPRNTRYASWSIKNEFPTAPTATTWMSKELNYISPGTTDPIVVNTPLNVYNTNGELSGFLSSNGQTKLRLSGESYGIVDLQPFKDEISDNNNWSRLGFTFSVTLKTDLHPFSDRTIFFIGNYSSDGTFSEGIKVGLEDIVWSYTDGNIKETISCKLQQNVINTLDFIVDKNNSEVKIFINGVLNAAREIKSDFTWKTTSKFYLACDADANGNIGNFADVELYDMRFFRSALNDKQIVINALNARANASLMSDGTVDFSLYNSWKSKNFFSTSESTASSTLWDDQNNTYANINFDALISDSNKKPPLPVVYIDCGGSGFTKAVYEAVGANPTEYTGCTFNYFDPNSTKSSAVSTGELSVQIQGTSSTGYRSKNLEIIFRKELYDDLGGLIGPELFQPNNTWMPESQFTLKADVVDSAHANNASIGKWINDNADLLFDKTPPMEQLESRRPVDTRDKTVTHQNVTIKHTLEGFPCILLIKFDGTDTQEMLGIYSFNLGRNAYFNMGFKFFKSFSRRIKDSSGQYQENPVPAFITTYETYKDNENFGTIDQRQIYSYEFSENANIIIKDDGTKQMTALFMQDDLSILQHVGEFRYNGANGDNSDVSDNNIWQRLQLLFTDLASMTGEAVDKYRWNVQTKGYEKTGDQYAAQQSWSALADDLTNRLNIRNAYSYYIVCIAFGLVDSLGKNMTLRSWNVGGSLTDENMNKWWPCFYDMDTAFGLSNTGEENVPKTAYLDTFANAKVESGVNSLVITQNSADGGYDTYSARLWDVLRDTRFINTGVYSGAGYDALWETWRSVGTLLKEANYFVDNYFSIQMKNCGELLYNYDYKVKYLTRYSKDEGSAASYANIEFLHGPRVKFVRDWLKKRYYFMDGVFQYSNSALIQPYNEKGAFKCGGAEGQAPILTVKSNCPLIFTVNIGQTSAGDIRYFIDENIPTTITLSPISSFNTQITINGISQISQLDGLKYMRFQGFMSTLRLPSFANVDISGVKTLSSAPILFETAFINDQDFSDVRHIDLSNTSFWSGNSGVSTFTVNIEKYTKLKDLNISGSCVTSLSLPNASLASLNITNSDVEKITLQSQPFLSSIDFTGCKKLKTVIIDSCTKIETLTLTSLGDLDSVTVTGCPSLKTIVCTSNTALSVFSVSNSNNIETIDLSNCNNRTLQIYIVGAAKLKKLNLSGTTTPDPIQLAQGLSTITSLDISNSSVSAFQFGNNPIPTYKGEYVLDLSSFALSSLSLRNAGLIKYIKFDNNKNNPFVVGGSFFSGCSSLIRVFGHLALNGGSIFSNCNKFFIHDAPSTIPTPMIEPDAWFGADTSTEAGKLEWATNNNLDTNFTLVSSSINSAFSTTACTLYDVYYILNRGDNLTNLDSVFNSCKNVVTSVANSLNRNTFKHCSKVTSISGLFWDCGSLEGIYYSPTHDDNGNITAYDGLLSPLVNCTNISNAFRTRGRAYMDEYFLAPVNAEGQTLKLTSLSWSFPNEVFIKNASKPKTSIAESDKIYAKASKLLRYLPNLTSLSAYCSSTESKVEFDLDTYTENGVTASYCPLLFYNTKLTTIYGCFSCIGKGSLLNLFGGDEVFNSLKDRFPQALQNIRSAFNCVKEGSDTVLWPIKNSMFNKIKSTLRFIGPDGEGNFTTSGGSFAGSGIVKSYVPDLLGDKFPYDVFKGCVNLIEAPAFFARMVFPSDTTTEIPGTVFNDCVKLTNVSYMFYNMSNVKYSLTSKGFKNCRIVNASNCFMEDTSNYCKIGKIPYGLFYQETDVRKQFIGWSHTDAASAGITETFGITEDGQWIPDEELPTQLPNTKTYEFTRKKLNNTIRNIEGCLRGFRSTDASQYLMDWGNLEYGDSGDLIGNNENYNPVEFIKNSAYDPREVIPNPAYNPENPGAEPETIPNPNRDIRRVLKNADYDPYEEMWNYWAVDGRVGMKGIIENSNLYRDVMNDTVTTLPKTIPDTMVDENDSRVCMTPAAYTAKRLVMNYICPPDFFRYCENVSSLNVNFVFANSGTSSDSTGNYQSFGICGRIPPRLFEPISNVTKLEGIFYYCFMVNPYTWPDSVDAGTMYPPNLFSTLRGLVSVKQLFSFTEIPSNITVPSSLFINNLSLQDLDRTWMCCRWYSDATLPAQIPSDLFSRNSALGNLRGTFSVSSISVDSTDGSSASLYTYGRNPAKIDSGLVTRDKHSNIVNVSYIFGGCKTTQGTVPEFWNWLNKLSLKYRTQPFYQMSKASITNSANMLAEWSIGMND
mgnify:CR=1 FL=1|jgi:hypothetical protein